MILMIFYVFCRMDKWVESDIGIKWGDKWEEKFDYGVGIR